MSNGTKSQDGRNAHLKRALGEKLFTAVQESRILCVGAGGIGCELMKNFVLSGFRNIELIDLDTIDVSNLNRQFLFRSRHVGMSKSMVAREAAMEFNSDVSVKSYHGNVKDKQFGLKYFQSFDLVINALDNVNARQHVNRLCLAADIPLIDSGTTGYLGQTDVIKKGETKCYDCEPKSDQAKVYPICTIRNTPDKPVHCIVWAKELFKLMFGNMDESMLSGTSDAEEEEEAADPADAAAAAAGGKDLTEEEVRKTAEIKEKEKEVRSLIMTAVQRPEGAALDDKAELERYARGVFAAVFDVEIQLKLQMREGYKGAKKKPQPLTFEQAMADDSSADGATVAALRDQRVLSLRESAEQFVASVLAMWAPDRRSAIGDASFDKDDSVALDFVTASANMRSHVFNIERKSKFDVKGIAGNIIHAIATTNAIVAGLQVLEAFKLLAKLKKAPMDYHVFNKSSSDATADDKDTDQSGALVTEHCRSVWVVREPIGRGFLLQPSTLGSPNPQCYSCGNAILTLSIDTSVATLGLVVEKVLKKRMGINEPSVMLNSSELYLEGEGLEPDEEEDFRNNLGKVLEACPAGGIRDGTMLDCDDNSQDCQFKLVIQHKSNEQFKEEENAELFSLSGDAPKPKEDSAAAAAADSSTTSTSPTDASPSTSAAVDDDDIVLVVDGATGSGSGDKDGDSDGKNGNGKRPCEVAIEREDSTKRTKEAEAEKAKASGSQEDAIAIE